MNKKLLSIAAGTTLAVTVTAGNAVASENPFGMSELDSGYQLAMSIMPEGSCGGKGDEGKCGEGKCGEKKATEAKCGEGKCGGTGL